MHAARAAKQSTLLQHDPENRVQNGLGPQEINELANLGFGLAHSELNGTPASKEFKFGLSYLFTVVYR